MRAALKYACVFNIAAAGVFTAGPALAHEYALPFIPLGNFENLVVAGYSIVGKKVVGNCSYVQITSGSGRDPRQTYTQIPQTCTWSLYGTLLSIASGAPAVPAPIATQGTETIYARVSKGLYAGFDSSLGPSPLSIAHITPG